MQPEEGRHVLQYAARPPAAVARPPARPRSALRAEDTSKCKKFSPAQCAIKSFVKKCRASCHAEYPLMKYCKSYVSEARFAELEAKFEALQRTPGPKGEKGADGAKGDKGDTGEVGAPGQDGAPGMKGERAPAAPLAHRTRPPAPPPPDRRRRGQGRRRL